MANISRCINHISTSTLGVTINFKNERGPEVKKFENCCNNPFQVTGWPDHIPCTLTLCSSHTKTFYSPQYVMLAPPSCQRPCVNLQLFTCLTPRLRQNKDEAVEGGHANTKSPEENSWVVAVLPSMLCSNIFPGSPSKLLCLPQNSLSYNSSFTAPSVNSINIRFALLIICL